MLLLSAPSGAGKTTLAQCLLDRHGGPDGSLVRSVSVTTRPRRPGEVSGEDYIFVTEQRFASLLSAGDLLEYADLYGHRYGTPRSFVEGCLERGVDVLLVLDARGRRQIAQSHAAALVSVFLLPPSLDELEKRLRRRHTDGAEAISSRLAAARDEITYCTEYDHVLLNRDLDMTLELLDTILRLERFQRDRSKQMIQTVHQNDRRA